MRLEKPHDVENIWEPYWVIGTMKTASYQGELATAVYRMAGDRLEKYDY